MEIMPIEYQNAKKRFDKPILSAFANSNTHCFEFALYPLQWYRQIFFENLLPNRRFGVEIVYLTTISTIYNHYKHRMGNIVRKKGSSHHQLPVQLTKVGDCPTDG